MGEARVVRPAVLGAFAVGYLIWGSTYLAIRYAIETLPSFLMAGTHRVGGRETDARLHAAVRGGAGLTLVLGFRARAALDGRSTHGGDERSLAARAEHQRSVTNVTTERVHRHLPPHAVRRHLLFAGAIRRLPRTPETATRAPTHETMETEMRRLIVSEWMTLDGVVQAPIGASEDTDGGFAHGGWHLPHAGTAEFQR